MLCQVTSNPYGDPIAIELSAGDFSTGSLQLTSYARPGKLFTASDRLIVWQIGTLTSSARTRIVDAIVQLLRK